MDIMLCTTVNLYFVNALVSALALKRARITDIQPNYGSTQMLMLWGLINWSCLPHNSTRVSNH